MGGHEPARGTEGVLQPKDSSLGTEDKMWSRAEPEGCPKRSKEPVQPPDASGHGERRGVQPSTWVQGGSTQSPPDWEMGYFPPRSYCTEPAALRMGNCEGERER